MSFHDTLPVDSLTVLHLADELTFKKNLYLKEEAIKQLP